MNCLKKDCIVELLKDSGIYLLILMVSIISFSTVMFFLKVGITKNHLGISLLISLFSFYVLNRKKKIYLIIFPIFLSLIVLFFSIYINKIYLDLSWDGNTYHKDAVGLLKNGWNPVYDDYIETYKSLGNRNMDYIGNEISGTHGFWQTYYAKGTWIIGSNIYAFTRDIETGKAYNILAIYITFVFILYILNKATGKIIGPLVIALLAAFNPIIFAQCFTYYNDGFLGNLLILLNFLMFLFNVDDERIDRKELIFLICCLLLLLINTKFTGFGYAGVFCLGYYLYFIFKKFRQKKLSDIIKPSLVFLVTVVFSVFVVGFSPYTKNIIEKRPIFYPLMGVEKVDIVSYNQPKQFKSKSNIYKFLKSTLSKTSNINEKSLLKPTLKMPFSLNEKEFADLYNPDLRIGGFGPLFSGIFIVSIVIILLYLLKLIKSELKIVFLTIIPLSVSMMLIVFISESWWARYSPYIYLVPILALTMIAYSKSKFRYLLFLILSIPMIGNILIFYKYNTVVNYKSSRIIIERLDNIDKNEKILVVDRAEEFIGLLYDIEDRGFNFSVTIEPQKGMKEFYKFVKYVKVE